MHSSCRNLTNKNYGGKGIAVCAEWRDFATFYDWAVNAGYQDGLTIERLDNALGYSPNNCTWATRKTQNRNRSIVRMQSPGVAWAEVAEGHEVPVAVMNNRICSGKWSPEKAATTPVCAVKRAPARDATGRFVAQPNGPHWKR